MSIVNILNTVEIAAVKRGAVQYSEGVRGARWHVLIVIPRSLFLIELGEIWKFGRSNQLALSHTWDTVVTAEAGWLMRPSVSLVRADTEAGENLNKLESQHTAQQELVFVAISKIYRHLWWLGLGGGVLTILIESYWGIREHYHSPSYINSISN